jgi:hypothetical protein
MVAIGNQPKMFTLAFGEINGEGVQLGYKTKENLIEAMRCLALLIEEAASVDDAVMTIKKVAEKQGFTVT